jgi:hypothetical protein
LFEAVDQYYDALGELPPRPGADALPVADHVTKSLPLSLLAFPANAPKPIVAKKEKILKLTSF